MNLKSDNYKSWEINEKDFPEKEGIEQKIKFILGYAVLAPSTFNSQPWKCKIIKNKLEVYLDRSRITEKSDKSERFAHISMGAFLENILVASDYFGLKTELKLVKHKKTELQHIASINFSYKKREKNKLFKAIKIRSTNRSLHKKKLIENKIQNEIYAFQDKEIKIKFFDSRSRAEIIDISKLGDFNIWTDIEFRKEHVAWVRNNLTKEYDGMPGFGVGANTLTSFLATPVILSPIFPKFQSKKNVKAIKSTNHFLVISSKESFDEWLRVGMLFEKIALTLTNYGINISPMGQFIEDEQARSQLKKLVKPQKDFNVQIFTRVGYSKNSVPHSPRFPIENILI